MTFLWFVFYNYATPPTIIDHSTPSQRTPSYQDTVKESATTQIRASESTVDIESQGANADLGEVHGVLLCSRNSSTILPP